jgi:hypothetical protein
MSIGNRDIGCSLDSGAFATYSVLVFFLLSMHVVMLTVSRSEYIFDRQSKGIQMQHQHH